MECIIIIAIIALVVKAIEGNSEKEERKKEANEQQARQKAAEDYILNSGDQEAIKQLMLMRANPANYKSPLAKQLIVTTRQCVQHSPSWVDLSQLT
ncbi:hypothetical protein OAL10_04520 [Gammaproteobacteria bacterium]|nr:hypothetical protein [Gammaproteobacteria bacterium]